MGNPICPSRLSNPNVGKPGFQFCNYHDWGWNPSQSGNDLGMVYGFRFTTLMYALSKFGVSFFVSDS